MQRTMKSVVLKSMALAVGLLVLVSGTALGAKQVQLQILSTTIVENPEGRVEEAIAKEFMASNPDIVLEFLGTPMNNAYQRLTTLAVGGVVPDVFTNTPEFIAQAADMGIAADLRELFEPEYLAGFDPNVMKEAVYDGQVLFLPWFTIPYALIYRTDWLAETGLEPPETWDDFLKVAAAMTKDTDGDGVIDRWGFALLGSRNNSAASRLMPVLWTYGVTELGQNEKGEWYTELDSPAAIEAMDMLASTYKKGYVPPGVLQTSYAEAVTQMALEKTGMMISGPHTIGAIIAQNPSLAGKFAAVPIPAKVQHASTLGTYGFAIAADSSHQAEAVRYLKHLMSTENLLEWNRVTGRLPVRLEALQSADFDHATFGGFVEASKYARTPPQAPIYAEVQIIVADAFQKILTDAATAEQAMRSAAAQVRNLISRM